MKKPINIIIVSILSIAAIILGTNYFVQNPIPIGCADVENLLKIIFPLCFTGAMFLILRITGKGMYGEIQTKTVFLIGFLFFLITDIFMYVMGEIKPADNCNSFVMFGYISVSANFIFFAFFATLLGNYFEKVRNKIKDQKPRQGAYS